MTVVDLFAGPGGWDAGVRHLGIRPVGYEWDDAACATGREAGHARVQADIAALDPREQGEVEGLIASPPCQGFSMAGKGQGRIDSRLLLRSIPFMRAGNIDAAITWLHGQMRDSRSILVLEPLRWALQLQPRWLAWEQVPGVLPIWEACAEVLRAVGYSVATGRVYAERYGVPQTRVRAILVASLDREARLPAPTHSRYYSRTPERLDPGVRKWVSMAEALGSLYAMRSNYGTGGDPKARGERTADQPAPTITSKIGRNKWLYVNGNQANSARRPLDRPAPTVHFGHRMNLVTWEHRGMLSAGGNNTAGQRERPPSEPSATITGKGTAYWQEPTRRVSVAEAAVLQSFPADYPFQGSLTDQYRQVGDAVPPFLAYHIVKEIAGIQHKEVAA